MTLILPWNESLHQTRHATVGMIVGLIMLAKKKPKTGGLMLGASLLSFVVLRLTFALGR